MSGYIIISAIAVGLPSLAHCLPDVVAMLRARREDIPAVMQARTGRPGHLPEDDERTCHPQSDVTPTSQAASGHGLVLPARRSPGRHSIKDG